MSGPLLPVSHPPSLSLSRGWVALTARGCILVRMANHATFRMYPSVKHMLHSSLTGHVLKYRRVVIRGTLLLFVTTVARVFPVARRAGPPVQVRLCHVLSFDELIRVHTGDITDMTFGT